MSHRRPTKAAPASEVSPSEPSAAEASDVHRDVPPPAPDAPDALSVHWSKDFVEHLRLVHFALIAAAVGLVAVSSSRTSPDYEHARAQLAEIRLLETRLTQKAHDPLAALEGIFAQQLVRYEPLDNPTDFAPLRNVSSYTAAFGRLNAKDLPGGHIDVALGPHVDTVFRDYYSLVGPTDRDNQKTEPFGQLGYFRDLWNGLATHQIYEVPSWYLSDHQIFIVPYSDKPGTRIFQGGKGKAVKFSAEKANTASAQLIFDKCAEGLIPIKRFFRVDCKWSYGGDTTWQGDGQQLYIPLYSTPRRVEVQRSVVAMMADQHWHTGTFAESFPDLAELSIGLEALPMDGVDTVLRNLGKRSESFEFGAIKFPVEDTALWGAIIILSIQLYLWLHLSDFVLRFRAHDDGWDVAWVGMYHTVSARAVVFISLVILPSLAIGYSGFRSLGPLRLSTLMHPVTAGYTAESFIIVSIFASIVVSVISWRRLVEMRRVRVPSAESKSKPNNNVRESLG